MDEKKELQKVEQQVGFVLNPEDIKTLIQAQIIPNGTPEPIIKLFARVCAEKQLSPFSRQIHLVPRRDNKSNFVKYTIQIGIDGLRAIAERTGKYAGTDDYLFDEGLTLYQMLNANRNRPTTATATVYKILPNGQTFPIRATARWDEYYPGEKVGFMWDKMPFLMLGKVAEALALRKAFPDALGGLYADEEMHQAGDVVEIIDDSQPKKITNQDKITKEERQKLIDLANHPIFERMSNGKEQDRVIILRIASDPKLTREKYEEIVRKCEAEIQKTNSDIAKEKIEIYNELIANEKLAMKLTGVVFPEKEDIQIFVDLLNAEEIPSVKEKINQLKKEFENEM